MGSDKSKMFTRQLRKSYKLNINIYEAILKGEI